MTGGPGRRRRERGGRNVSHRITPYTNRLLSTLSEPIIWANSHPDVCLCVGRHHHLLLLLLLRLQPRCLSHVPLLDFLKCYTLSAIVSVTSEVFLLGLKMCKLPAVMSSEKVRALTQFPSQLRGVFRVAIGRSASRAGVIWGKTGKHHQWKADRS